MGCDYIFELRSPAGLFFFPQMIHEFEERRWNDIDRGKPNNSEKTCPSAFVMRKCHMDWPGREFEPPRWEADD
jgi:hypothetical protein